MGDHSVGNENSALLLENSKFNAALRVSTWFGFQKPEVMLEKIINQMNAPKSVRIEGDDTDSDYSVAAAPLLPCRSPPLVLNGGASGEQEADRRGV